MAVFDMTLKKYSILKNAPRHKPVRAFWFQPGSL
jgi:hypothetical protein